MAPNVKLGYWSIRGVSTLSTTIFFGTYVMFTFNGNGQYGQPIRLLLAYAGVEYEDRRYDDTTEEAVWFQEKPNLGLDFPNVKYYF